MQSETNQQMNCCKPRCCGNDIFIEADFIYWVAKQEGNDFAVTGAAITVPGTLDPNTGLTAGSISDEGKTYAPHARIKPGFKAGIGCDIRNGNWELFAEYTFLYSEAKKSVSSDDVNGGILPIFSYVPNNGIFTHATFDVSGGATGIVSAAHANWNLHFNNVNLELRKELQLCPCFTLRPHFGLQGSWQQQRSTYNYTVASFSNVSNVLGNSQVKYHQDYWGIGLRAGLDSVWEWCDHIGLYANTAVSALWGRFDAHAHAHDTSTLAPIHSDVLVADQTNNLHTVNPVLQLEAGVQFDWCWCDDYQFLLQAGWEEQVWFFQNQHSSSIANTSLVLEGLTVRLGLEF